MKNYQYNCICPNNEEELNQIIDNMLEVDYNYFIGGVNIEDVKELEKNFIFPLNEDWSVTFCEAELEDKTVLLFRHSGIEYIFY